jgi:hypothetical protein
MSSEKDDEFNRICLESYQEVYNKLGDFPAFLMGSKVKVIDKHDRNYRSEGHIVAPIDARKWSGIEQILVWVRFSVGSVPYGIHQLKVLKRINDTFLQQVGQRGIEKVVTVNGLMILVRNLADSGRTLVNCEDMGISVEVYRNVMSGKGALKHKLLIQNAISKFHEEALGKLRR